MTGFAGLEEKFMILIEGVWHEGVILAASDLSQGTTDPHPESCDPPTVVLDDIPLE